MFRLRAVGAQGPPLNAESFDWRVAAQRQGVCYLRFLESTFVLRALIRRGALALIRGSDVLRGFVCAKQRNSTVCLRRCFGRRVSSRRSPQDSTLAESIPTTWSNRKMEARHLLQQA